MSGTSLDGVDAVLAAFDAPGRPFQTLAPHHQAFEPALRQELLALNQSGADELNRAALAANGLSRAYASATAMLLQASGQPPTAISALGAHGQTVRHRPGEFDGSGYTLQLLNGALLAELTGIDVVCDLRSRDVAAGGQGAPLVPAFHAAVFAQPGQAQAVLNLGGIGNVTLLGADGGVSGFDCGPGNALLDHWCERHTGQAFDESGLWSAQGRVDAALLARLLAEPFFHRAPPKSTGRDLFHPAWLQAMLDDGHPRNPVDVQATLAQLTVDAATHAVRQHLPGAQRLLVCGGGAFNADLIRRLAQGLPGCTVQTTDTAGLPPMQVEAAAFAWLAQA
ncbi:MAG: anhydro-N-acetylmuramic acid kinase, partial [Burkholderiales bacterium PBB5]